MKKIVALCMSLALVLSLAACGSDDSKETTQSTTQAGTQAATQAGTEAQASSGETKAEVPADAKTFILGGLGPLTGGAASYGISVKQGAEIAVEEINAAGGVKVGSDTYLLQLNFADDENDAETAITAYGSLVDQGIQALIGCVTSAPCIAVAPITSEDGILQVTPSGSAIACVEYDNAFRLCFTDPLQGKTMAEFAVNELGLKKIAVIYNNSDEYSTGMKDAFEETITKLGGTIVASEAFNDGDVDFTTQLTTIKGTDAEIIFCPIYYEAAANITQQARENGITLPFIGGDGWDGVLGQVTDPKAVEGAVFLSPFLATDPAVADFVSTYQTKYNATPDQFAADGYDTVYVIKSAMEKAGSIENADLIAAMTQIEVDGLTGKVTFTADGEPNKTAKFIEIKNGEYTAR